MVRKVLDAVALAALASGMTLSAATGTVATVAAPSAEAAAAAAATAAAASDGIGLADAAAAAAATEALAAAATAATAAAAATTASVVAADAGVVSYLQGQVATKDGLLLAAGVETANLKARVTEFEASVGGLQVIAAQSLNNMRVALGGSSTDLSALTPTQLLAQHTAAAADFEKTFVAGGVAAVDAAQASKATSSAPDSLEVARLNAVLG